MHVKIGPLSMAIQACTRTTVMTVCVAWVAGLVTEMDVYGVVVARLKNTAIAQSQESKKRKSNFLTHVSCELKMERVSEHSE